VLWICSQGSVLVIGRQAQFFEMRRKHNGRLHKPEICELSRVRPHRAAQACHGARSRARLRVGVEGIMTDAGGFIPDDASARAVERQDLLRQIADAVNLPVSSFRHRSASRRSPHAPTASECAALLAAFARIEDPERRKACLAMVERYGAA
jgi:hypothetical protein